MARLGHSLITWVISKYRVTVHPAAGSLAMCSAGEYFLYMTFGLCCMMVAFMGVINGVALIYPLMCSVFGLICFWLPFIIYTIYEDV